MSDRSVEADAERIAARGREGLVAQLRDAFEKAAARHADVVSLEPERIEELVQRSADSADGLQWRRALAGVACEELGVSLVEALAHPAVVRAHELVGAPSYEGALGEPTSGQTVATDAGLYALEGDLELEEADELLPDEPPAEDTPERLNLTAVHLGGVANLPTNGEAIGLRVSRVGLDIVRGSSHIVGRLGWSEIDKLDVPAPRGRSRRRRQSGDTRLVVRTDHGDASFEVHRLTNEELRSRLEPLIERFGRS